MRRFCDANLNVEMAKVAAMSCMRNCISTICGGNEKTVGHKNLAIYTWLYLWCSCLAEWVSSCLTAHQHNIGHSLPRVVKNILYVLIRGISNAQLYILTNTAVVFARHHSWPTQFAVAPVCCDLQTSIVCFWTESLSISANSHPSQF